MAIISPDTFDPLRRYVAVRLAQGVPLADADWNEGDDMRRYELRAFLRWFVGDGVPLGNDGFRIAATGSATSFTITAGGLGPGALQAGRMLVEGLEAFITADVGFDAQPLHASQPGAVALAAAWGVPLIAPLPAPPPVTRTLAVCLDVWERLVTLAEDPGLVLPGLGTETCSRVRREWAVRVREANAAPVIGDPDFVAGHSYGLLAIITQTAAGAINAPDVVDRRRRGVSLPSQMDFNQVLADTFGGGYGVDGSGVPQLVFPIRDVLNAMLRERPAAVGPFTVLAAGGPFNTPASTIDPDGIPWVFWVRVAGPNRFLAFTRFIAGAWTAPADAFQFVGVLTVSSIAAASQPDGTVRVFYTALAGNNRVFSRRFNGAWQAEELVDVTDQASRISAATGAAGDIVAVWQRDTAGVLTAQTATYPLGGPPGGVVAAGTMTRPGDHAVTFTPAGEPQVVYVEQPNPLGPNWRVLHKRFVGGAWEVAFTDTLHTVPVDTFVDLAAGYGADGALWVFYATVSAPGFSTLRARRVVVGVTETRELLPPAQTARFPSITVDAAGNAGLYFQNGPLLQQLGLVQRL